MQTPKVYLRNMGRKICFKVKSPSSSCGQPYNFLVLLTMSFSSKDRKITSSRFLSCSTLWRTSENGYLFPLHSVHRILPTLLFFMPSLFTNPMSRAGIPALQTVPSSWKSRSSSGTRRCSGQAALSLLPSHNPVPLFLWGWTPGIHQVAQLPSRNWLPVFRGNSPLSAPV